MAKPSELLAPEPQETAVAMPVKTDTIGALLEKNKEGIARALPKQIDPQRFSRIVLTAIRSNPKLMECKPVSLIKCVVKSAQLGLALDNGLGEAYLVPFNVHGRLECTFIPGYRGLMKLARNSGVHFEMPRSVHQGDHFEYSIGLESNINFKPLATDRTENTLTHVFAIVKLPDGSKTFDVMTRAEIEAIRTRSKSKDSGPWKTDYIPMAIKTVLRRICKYLPASEELAHAVYADEAADRGETVDFRELELVGADEE